MKQKLIITAAIACMLGGLWWQFKGSSNGSANPEPASPTTTTTTPTDPTKQEDYFDQEDPTNPTADTVESGEAKPRNLATEEEMNRCVPVENGFGIVMKDWGKIRLPYGDTWPKNEPGQPIDCAPETDFGAAVVAAHVLFIESASPELIPEIAMDTPARQFRIDNHEGKSDVNDLGFTCTALGWDRPQPGISIWFIYHQCGDGPVNVTPVRMQHDTGEWLMVYNGNARIVVEEAEPETPYFPFEGGD